MKLHIEYGEPREVRDVIVGQALCGVAVSKVELTAEDFRDPRLFEYLQETIGPRMVPQNQVNGQFGLPREVVEEITGLR